MTLTKEEYAHLYELAYGNFQDCFLCDTVKAKLEFIIGEKKTKQIQKLLTKYPYGNKD